MILVKSIESFFCESGESDNQCSVIEDDCLASMKFYKDVISDFPDIVSCFVFGWNIIAVSFDIFRI